MTEPFLLSVREFAREEGLGRDNTYQLVREGRIRWVKVNRTIKIPRTEITDFPAREIERERETVDGATSPCKSLTTWTAKRGGAA